MAVESAMFVFEVVVGKIESFVDSHHLMIRSEFGDVFSLELKDPKLMNIVIPEPPPPPPDPPGKKKKAPKPKKPKKGKKGAAVPLPPPEPVVQAGQSVLFTSTAEFLIQTMKNFPLEVSLWSFEDYLMNIGSISIPWDPRYLQYLEQILKCGHPSPITINEEYNVRDEDNAKIMAKIGLQVKLIYLKDRMTTSFRCLSEDLNIKKYLYTGINNKVTSYMCTLKTSDEAYLENDAKLKATYVVDKPVDKKMVYADFKNAPGAEITLETLDICCQKNADKPPDTKYKVPETMPDIDFIIEYVRKIILSCNDNMRMLTPRPAIKPRVKATDMDRLCYCRETRWPEGDLAERFRAATQTEPCPVCISAGAKPEGSQGLTYDITQIRGPCGRPDCKVARRLREYIEELICEDNREICLYDIIGPCGNKTCNVARKIKEFLLRDGPFSDTKNVPGLSTQCACVEDMQKAIEAPRVCMSDCEKKCEDNADDSDEDCFGSKCPFKFKDNTFIVNYFTVEYDFEKETPSMRSSRTSSPPGSTKSRASSPQCCSVKSKTSASIPLGSIRSRSSATSKKSAATKSDSAPADPETAHQTAPIDKFKFCGKECPSREKYRLETTCSKATCASSVKTAEHTTTCASPECAAVHPLESPADSNVVIDIEALENPCGLVSCEVAEKVKTFLKEGIEIHKNRPVRENPCVCECECSFKFTKKTTYCPVCGGYECLGDDMTDVPAYSQPHPCPIYHKLYDKTFLRVKSPWPEENDEPARKEEAPPPKKKIKETLSLTRRRSTASKTSRSGMTVMSKLKVESKAASKGSKSKSVTQQQLPLEEILPEKPKTKAIDKYPPYPKVPKNMGWNWVAEDIPGMKPRPKWKPGATLTTLVRRYKSFREGGDNTLSKKKRANLLNQKKKKIENKPTVVIKKHKGDYIVQMEVMKKYSKDRFPSQYPYEDVPPVVYTIGKTQEELDKLKKQKDRRERREKRKKAKLLQSTFQDKCQEVCLKSYNRAIGILPPFDPNNPECPCDSTKKDMALTPPIDSCSCSDEDVETSDSDGDSWTIEFTPPVARWDPQLKHPPVKSDNESQYHFSDYRVKLLDKYGKELPRFFTGLDGKQLCSDLGGFWGPGHVWFEIHKDGYIGPDGRWIPYSFIGPDGGMESSKEGVFTDKNGQTWRIGIDGFIDKDGKWAWYRGRPKPPSPKKQSGNTSPQGKKITETKATNKDQSEKKDGKNDVDKGKSKQNTTANISATTGKSGKSGKSQPKAKKGGLGATNQVAMMTHISNKLCNTKRAPYWSCKQKNMGDWQCEGSTHMSPWMCEQKRILDNCKANKRMSKYNEILNDLDIYSIEYTPLPECHRASNSLSRRPSPELMKLY